MESEGKIVVADIFRFEGEKPCPLFECIAERRIFVYRLVAPSEKLQDLAVGYLDGGYVFPPAEYHGNGIFHSVPLRQTVIQLDPRPTTVCSIFQPFEGKAVDCDFLSAFGEGKQGIGEENVQSPDVGKICAVPIFFDPALYFFFAEFYYFLIFVFFI